MKNLHCLVVFLIFKGQLKSAKPFSSYEALKMGREILIEVGNVVFRLLEPPITAENDVIVEQ